MDAKLSSEQEDLIQSIRGALERHRITNPYPSPSTIDVGALKLLDSLGYLDIIESGGSPVDVVLVIEAAAALAPGAPVAARALVAPIVISSAPPEVVALGTSWAGSLCRFANEAEGILYLGNDDAWYLRGDEFTVESIESRWGYPVGRVTPRDGSTTESVEAKRLLTAWRIALAAEIGGLMEAATLLASAYVSERFQFGRSIGSIQTVQHRLARSYVASQATKWLARRAAWDVDDHEAAAAAACYATSEAPEVLASVQQVCGAIGFTDEFGLTRFTARLAMLQTELGGPWAHARSVAELHWPASTG